MAQEIKMSAAGLKAVREELEYQEHRRLNPLAAFSDKSSGRPSPKEMWPDDVRTCYMNMKG